MRLVHRISATRRHGWRIWPPRMRATRGQALIEFTFFFTFMMLILAGVTDVAFLVDAHMNVVYAARQGARTGSVLGQGVADKGGTVIQNPDCAILGAVHATLQNQSDVTVTQITIYRSTSTGQTDGVHITVYPGAATCGGGSGSPGPTPTVGLPPPPAPPLAAPAAVLPTPIPIETPTPGASNPTPGPTTNGYPPSIRNNTPLTEDSLGVKIDYTFQFRFNLWQGGVLSLSDSAVFPINPTGLPTPLPS